MWELILVCGLFMKFKDWISKPYEEIIETATSASEARKYRRYLKWLQWGYGVVYFAIYICISLCYFFYEITNIVLRLGFMIIFFLVELVGYMIVYKLVKITIKIRERKRSEPRMNEL